MGCGDESKVNSPKHWKLQSLDLSKIKNLTETKSTVTRFAISQVAPWIPHQTA